MSALHCLVFIQRFLHYNIDLLGLRQDPKNPRSCQSMNHYLQPSDELGLSLPRPQKIVRQNALCNLISFIYHTDVLQKHNL